MIEKFNGIIYLAVFIIHFIGYGVYAYRCVFGTQSFSRSIMAWIKNWRFNDKIFWFIVYWFNCNGTLYYVLLEMNGVDGTWGFFNLVFLQNLCCVYSWYLCHQN